MINIVTDMAIKYSNQSKYTLKMSVRDGRLSRLVK